MPHLSPSINELIACVTYMDTAQQRANGKYGKFSLNATNATASATSTAASSEKDMLPAGYATFVSSHNQLYGIIAALFQTGAIEAGVTLFYQLSHPSRVNCPCVSLFLLHGQSHCPRRLSD